MSWIPPSIEDVCSANAQLSTCQPPAYVFLSFLASLFSYSIDEPFGSAKDGLLASQPVVASSRLPSILPPSRSYDPVAIVDNQLEARSFDYYNGLPRGYYTDYLGDPNPRAIRPPRTSRPTSYPDYGFATLLRYEPSFGRGALPERRRLRDDPSTAATTTTTTSITGLVYPPGLLERLSGRSFGASAGPRADFYYYGVPVSRRPIAHHHHHHQQHREPVRFEDPSYEPIYPGGEQYLEHEEHPRPALFPEPAGFTPEVYDFVIVGAGSAGCAIANRLSEVGHWKV